MVDKLISKVSINRTRRGFTTYTDKQQRGISHDILARKLGIELDKAKRTLQYTTQDNLIFALKPLTRQHRIDFLP